MQVALHFNGSTINAPLPALGIASRVVDSVDNYLFTFDLVQDFDSESDVLKLASSAAKQRCIDERSSPSS